MHQQQQDLALSGGGNSMGPTLQELEIQQKLREGLLQRLRPKDKEIVERIRGAMKGQPLEDVLRRFARDNKDHISEDDLLIGVSKINANVYMGDLKDLIGILKAGAGSQGKISIAETLQLIGQTQ